MEADIEHILVEAEVIQARLSALPGEAAGTFDERSDGTSIAPILFGSLIFPVG